METKKGGLNSNQIKLIAIIAMTIDHLVWTIFPGTQHIWYVYALHIIGGLTAPIMWFFIAEGCYYTHDRHEILCYGQQSMPRYIFCFWISLMEYFRCLLSSRFRFWQNITESVVSGRA